MFPQAHLIGQNYAVYNDLLYAVIFLSFCMAACSLLLIRQGRSARFVMSVWTVFFLLILFGAFGLSASINMQRLLWRDSCSRLVASYANVLGKFNYQQIQPGNPNVFSNWSQQAFLQPNQESRIAEPDFSSSESSRFDKLPVPTGLSCRWEPPFAAVSEDKPIQVLRRNQWAVAALTRDPKAFGRCSWKITVQWNPEPKASTYRLQWAEFSEEENKAVQWFSVYSGSQPKCVLTAPEGRTLLFRVRCEDGTPEDDPAFNEIIDILDFPIRANNLIGYAYTLRYVDPQLVQFMASPISDANHNGFIDPKEIPNDIGEPCPVDQLFRYVSKHKKRAMRLEEFTDQWGKWFTVAEPLFNADGGLIGIFAMDFDAGQVYRHMFRGRIYPLTLFVLVILSYIGAVLFVNYLQLKNRKITRLAEELENAVTELTQAKAMTEKSLQSKTLFLTNVSHEFRTPLNIILGFAEILTRQIANCVSSDRNICTEAIRHMETSGKHLLEMVDNVLGVAAMNEDQSIAVSYAPVNLKTLINDIADLMQNRATSKSLTLNVVQADKIPERILSSLMHLRQVLIHLIGNALKFTEEGGITLRFGIASQPFSPAVPIYYIAVQDTGIGIDAAHLHSIFKPFSQSDPSFTRKYGGVGIGLSVARKSAEMLNGNITVESKLGEGSTFTFSFPARQG